MSLLDTQISTDFTEYALKDPKYNGIFNAEVLEDIPILRDRGELVIPDNFKIIDPHSLSGCTALRKLVLPEHVFMDTLALDSVYNLKEIVGPGHHVLGNSGGQFRNCTGLEKIWLKWVCERLPQEMFVGCINLKKITIGGNIGIINRGALDEVPEDCSIRVATTCSEIVVARQQYKYKHTIDAYVPNPKKFAVRYLSDHNEPNIIFRLHHIDEYSID